jgi:Ser/Thr protein kinase RdoA (MazF antagonist)
MQGDPFAVVAEVAPPFSEAAATRIARDHWGLAASASRLVSERDQNFRLTCPDGAAYVLKIANAAEPVPVTLFQVAALQHIAAADIRLSTPAILPTLAGETTVRLESDQGLHTTRVVTFLPGKPLGERIPSERLARDMGACLADLGRALAGFDHAGSSHSLLWDMQQSLRLRELIPYVASREAAQAVSDALGDFERFALPVLPTLRSQVIHSDMNPDNLLVDPDDSDVVSGVIDFGDMLRAPLIADVAIACAYLRPRGGDPLHLIAEFVAGYHRTVPLENAELDILFELIQARVSASITILDWRAATRQGDDPYLAGRTTGEGSPHHFLGRLRAVPRERAREVLRQVAGPAG